VTAVADTSTLCYLVLIGEIGLLPSLFTRVLIPPAVAAELADDRAPAAVRRWSAAPPRWLEVAEPAAERVVPGLERLHRGEQEVILLARQTGAGALLLDDKAARRTAKRLALPVMGLLGVLAAGAERGETDLLAALERLRRTNFRISAALLRDLVEAHRHGGGGGDQGGPGARPPAGQV
jgi:predicted nucleic acid-binding protein